MTEQEFEEYLVNQINLIPGANNLIDLSGIPHHPNVSFVLVGANTAVTEIRVSNTNNFAAATIKPWVFPTAVDGVTIINVAGFTWQYIWFVSGASADSIAGSVACFCMDRKMPANNASVATLVA